MPRYLEEINPHIPAEENIRKLCFIKSGILFNEFEQIFCDLFSNRSETYKQIVTYLADRMADQEKIIHLKKPRNISCRAILIHVNGVEETVEENDYFSKIIDFSHLLLQ